MNFCSSSFVVKLDVGHVLQREGLNLNSEELVWIRMLAAPVNPSDINQVQGIYPMQSSDPVRVGGNEGVGVVVTAGKRSTLKEGDWVIPKRKAFGTWREQIICSDEDVQKIPSDLPLSVASTFLVNPPSAYRMLSDFVSLKPGTDIILLGIV